MDRSDYLQQLHSRFSVAQSEIIATVEAALSVPVTNLTRIIKGDEYEVHRVQLRDDSTVYLRVDFPGTPVSMVEHEAWAMSCARDDGAPVPEVLGVSVIDDDIGPRAAMLVRASPGRPLAGVLASLLPTQRSTIMSNIGNVLAGLHSVRMPGAGRPNADGAWMTPAQERDRRLSDCLAAVHQLRVAAFSPGDIDRVKRALQQDCPSAENPVLCHGDISPEHVFVDSDLNVVGLIDWGMWSAGPAVAELAGLDIRLSEPDYFALATGYGRHEIRADSMRWHAIAQLVHQIDWLVSSEQAEELERPASVLREFLP
ncbi:phosphotransferase family protein [Microlunatus speluncae]|uniref:phosphotransferase family protein n=1 Tax=Microlunatus speluncae TaxID=2594267 RepID=UPI0012667691|nr:phosphotransferase [Microlunatus speluncae]